MRIAASRTGRWATLGLALALLLAAGGASLVAAAGGYALGWSAPGVGGTADGARYHLRGGVVAGGSGALEGGGYRVVLGVWPGFSADPLSEPTAVPSTPSPGEGTYLPLVRRGG